MACCPSRAFDQMPLLTELEVVSLRVSTKIPPLTGLPRSSCLIAGVPLNHVPRCYAARISQRDVYTHAEKNPKGISSISPAVARHELPWVRG